MRNAEVSYKERGHVMKYLALGITFGLLLMYFYQKGEGENRVFKTKIYPKNFYISQNDNNIFETSPGGIENNRQKENVKSKHEHLNKNTKYTTEDSLSEINKEHATNVVEEQDVYASDHVPVSQDGTWNLFDIRIRHNHSNVSPVKDYDAFPPLPDIEDVEPLTAMEKHELATVVLYNRVPKTGSSSIVHLMKDLRTSNNFSEERDNKTTYASASRSNQQEQQLCDRVKSYIDNSTRVFLHGHFYFVDLNRVCGIDNGYIWINTMRDPVNEFTSHFYYLRREVRFEKWRPPEDYFVKDIDDCILNNDPECQFILGHHREQILTFYCGNNLQCRKVGLPEDNIALNVAKFNIDKHYLAVGVLEEFDKFILILEALEPSFFGGINKRFLEEATHKKKLAHKNPSEEARSVLKSMLAADYDLYGFILQRMHLQMKRLNIEFDDMSV